MYEELFRQALRIRLVEERIIQLYPSDRIQSPVHLSIGQEAVSVGLCAALQPADLIYGSYRSHALYLASGGDLKAMFAELYGRVDGVSQGKAGSMHLTFPETGFMGSSAVVSSHLPHAVGSALAARRRGTGQIVVCVFGDAASEEGVAHESFNFAMLHKLPVLFVCENNGLAVHSRLSARQSYRIAELMAVYGCPTSRVEAGYDFLAVRDEMLAAAAAVRAGGPRFVEVDTYRVKEHVGPGEDFAAGYRSRDEFDHWRTVDPLYLDTALVARLTPAIEAEIDAAVAFAEASPMPGRAQLLTDVI